jgi:hypothetical protein
MLPPDSIKQLIYNMFSHLSTKLTEMLYDKNVPGFNMNFVEGLSADLAYIQKFTQEQKQDPLVMETFSEVQQLVNLMMTEQVHEFLDPIIRNRKYSSLRSNDVIPVLQKYHLILLIDCF